jgi:hypothetical protein
MGTAAKQMFCAGGKGDDNQRNGADELSACDYSRAYKRGRSWTIP